MRPSGRFAAAALLTVVAACDGGPSSPWAAPPSLKVDLRVAVEPLEVGLLQPVTVTVDRYRQRDVDVVLRADFDEADWVEQERREAPEAPLGEGCWQRTEIVLLPVRGPGELEVPALRAEAVAADGRDDGWFHSGVKCRACGSANTECDDMGAGNVHCTKAETWGNKDAEEQRARYTCRDCRTTWTEGWDG